MSGSLPTPPIPPSGAQPSSTPQQNITSTSLPGDGKTQTGQPLWIRRWKLTVGSASGTQAKDMSQFAFEFDVTLTLYQTINVAHVKVWNPPDDIVAKIGKEYTHVQLDAGYMSPSDQYGTIAKGQITYYRHGRQNATDTFLEMTLAMYDTAYTAAVVNRWMPAGTTGNDVMNAVIQAMSPYGVTLGQIPDMSSNQSPRGRTLVGMARDVLRDVARSQNATWFIDNDGKLHMLKQEDKLKMGNQTVPILNSRSGLLDVPTQVLGSGIEAHSLLNPSIIPGGQIRINQKSVTGVPVITSLGTTGSQMVQTNFLAQTKTAPVLDADGNYIVGEVKHVGQNRGTPWFSMITTKKPIQDVPAPPIAAT